jgi:hypothetical protein
MGSILQMKKKKVGITNDDAFEKDSIKTEENENDSN